MNVCSSPPTNGGYWKRALQLCRAHRIKSLLTALGLLLLVAIMSADALLAGPMKTWAERVMNSKLQGYTVQIARMHPHLWRLAFELDNLVLKQNSHPDPPVADFGALKFSVAWRELLRFKVAGDLIIDRPALHINLAQIQEEARSQVSLKDRGWQSAVESIYPIKLDRVTVLDGSLLYLSNATASKPLQLTKVYMTVRNVRNIATAKGTYPSPVTLEGILFETGLLQFQGAADFLREPHAAARGDIRLERVPLDRLTPLAEDYQLRTQGGFLSVKGSIEYTPELQRTHLTEVRFDGLRVDYVTSKATEAEEKEHARQALKLAKRLRNAPQVRLQMDTLTLTNSQIGFLNEASRPPYRLFMSGVNLRLDNVSNQSGQGGSTFQVRGTFMGSGTTTATGGFRAAVRPADFDVRLQMDDAKLVDLNGLFLAYAGVDVAEGFFSVYTELAVKNGRVDGYIKPLIQRLKIYDRRKDKDKSFGKRVEMHALQFLATLFKNRKTRNVATVIRISGSTAEPRTSEWEVIRKLIGNGLARGILPGFLDKPKNEEPSKPAK
jgi:hypothetical protein